jgi:hypothetical protein
MATAAVALVAATLGYLISDQISQNDRFDRTRTSLALTHQHAGQVAHLLAALHRDVAILERQVGAAANAWRQDNAQLDAAESTLALLQSDVSQQGSHITALHTCLVGIQQALNALAVDDEVSAVDALNSVETSCSVASGG